MDDPVADGVVVPLQPSMHDAPVEYGAAVHDPNVCPEASGEGALLQGFGLHTPVAVVQVPAVHTHDPDAVYPVLQVKEHDDPEAMLPEQLDDVLPITGAEQGLGEHVVLMFQLPK